MIEIIDNINNAQTEKELFVAGQNMRTFLKDCDDYNVRKRILAAWESKSRRMVNVKRVTTNY